MRVIAGTARRRVLVAPKGSDTTRPTTDRAKEGLFNMLQRDVAGARFLDLYCGSGAIGIEALSRGAILATFVECDREALGVLAHNLEHTKLASQGEVLPMKVEMAIARMGKEGRQYNIIFMDPPYHGAYIEETMQMLAEAKMLAEDGMLVVEKEDRVSQPNTLAFQLLQARSYGRTEFLFYGLSDGRRIS